MIIDKEYPATHSMATAWFCVDKDGNVGVFDIDDNGPVPDTDYVDTDDYMMIRELIWDCFTEDGEDGIRTINLTPAQIKPMLDSPREDKWVQEENYRGKLEWFNGSWMEMIVKIDMTKYDIFLKALRMKKETYCNPVCLSKEMGLFYVDFSCNKRGVELLLKNDVVLAKYEPIDDCDFDYAEEEKGFPNEEDILTFYVYRQGYDPGFEPCIRFSTPKEPMTIKQLPDHLQKKVLKLPVSFKDTKKIQLAEFVKVSTWSVYETYEYEKKSWGKLKMPDGSYGYYCWDKNILLREDVFLPLIESGQAKKEND